MTEIEQQMVAALRQIETERAAWSDAFESLQTEYATIRRENTALHERIEHLSGQVERLAKLVGRSKKR